MTNSFVFDKENILSVALKKKIDFLLLKFPKKNKRSVILASLHLLQDANGGFLSNESIIAISDYLLISKIFVFEVALFYSMYNLKNFVRTKVCICTNITCSLYGSNELVDAVKQRYKLDNNNISKDKSFFLCEVECLALCDKVPFIQVNKLYYFNLTKEKVFEILDKLV